MNKIKKNTIEKKPTIMDVGKKIIKWSKYFLDYFDKSKDPNIMKLKSELLWIIKNDFDGFLSDPVIKEQVLDDMIYVTCEINEDWVIIPEVRLKCYGCKQVMWSLKEIFKESKKENKKELSWMCQNCNKPVVFKFNV